MHIDRKSAWGLFFIDGYILEALSIFFQIVTALLKCIGKAIIRNTATKLIHNHRHQRTQLHLQNNPGIVTMAEFCIVIKITRTINAPRQLQSSHLQTFFVARNDDEDDEQFTVDSLHPQRHSSK